MPIRELDGNMEDAALGSAEELESAINHLFEIYRRLLEGDRRHLVDGFEYRDLARKVVGIGSVGTRTWVMLLFGRGSGDPLFLQIKEANESVLEPLLSRSEFESHGQRVVAGQRLMQAASDIFLGWLSNAKGPDGRPRDHYVRQLWDWKSSVRLEAILPEGLIAYARASGWTLARARARSGDRIAIASYLGKSDVFDRAIADFAESYADLNERDHGALVEAVRAGRIVAKQGL